MTEVSALRHQIEEAAEPVSQFWPMTSFVHHNPIHGLEHLPFDEAIREAKHLFGAEGYLPNEKYRGFYEAGRIQDRSVDRALALVGPKTDASISLASRTVPAAEVQRIHFLHGVDALEPALFDWEFASERVLSESRTGAASKVALDELWQLTLTALQLEDPRVEAHGGHVAKGDLAKPELPHRRALSDWLDELTGSSIVATVDEHMIKWVSPLAASMKDAEASDLLSTMSDGLSPASSSPSTLDVTSC